MQNILLSYAPLAAHISARISALGNIPALIHLLFRIDRQIDQSEPVEHPVNVSHTPDIAQSFWAIYYISHLFNIAQCQQYRTPRQTFAALSPVDPELFCIFAASTFSYFIIERQAGIGLKRTF